MSGATAFAELNAVLGKLVAGVRAALGSNLCGVYLQGSFAVGDADEHSDVDFIVALEKELADEEVESLRALHSRLHALPSEWARHLEGSYVPRTLLRRLDCSRTPLLYLDNGAQELRRLRTSRARRSSSSSSRWRGPATARCRPAPHPTAPATPPSPRRRTRGR